MVLMPGAVPLRHISTPAKVTDVLRRLCALEVPESLLKASLAMSHPVTPPCCTFRSCPCMVFICGHCEDPCLLAEALSTIRSTCDAKCKEVFPELDWIMAHILRCCHRPRRSGLLGMPKQGVGICRGRCSCSRRELSRALPAGCTCCTPTAQAPGLRWATRQARWMTPTQRRRSRRRASTQHTSGRQVLCDACLLNRALDSYVLQWTKA